MEERCYIAGRVSGLSREEYHRNFEQGEREVEALGLLPVSPLTVKENAGKCWADCMRNDIKLMLGCTHIYMLNNWGDSRGAKLEFQLAVELGFKVHYQPK